MKAIAGDGNGSPAAHGGVSLGGFDVPHRLVRTEHSFRREAEAKQSFDKREKAVLSRVLDIIGMFRSVDPAISAHTVEALLRVALEEGYWGVKEYAQKADMATTVMARNLLDLGARKRNMEPGMGLVEQSPDPYDMRTTQTFLTQKGRTLLRRVIDKVRG